jgi:hypothetical protein
MISPAEQGLAKAICFVLGLAMLYGYIAVVFVAGYKTAKGDK